MLRCRGKAGDLPFAATQKRSVLITPVATVKEGASGLLAQPLIAYEERWLQDLS